MKIALIGNKGLLGSELEKVFAGEDLHGFDSESCDITNEAQVSEVLGELKPEAVINAAAYTNVDEAEENKDVAFEVNAHGARNVADACTSIGATLVHISTDYVVGGTRRDGYSEDDDPGTPVNVYGQSKLMGESLIAQTLERHYIVRLSSLFGPGGNNFVSVMLKLAATQDELKVVGDQFMKPTYAPDVAATIKKMLSQKSPFGIYHLPNETPDSDEGHEGITWAQFAEQIFTIKYELDSSFTIPKVNHIKAAEWASKAQRPHYSALKNTKLDLQRDYKSALGDFLA